jgi:hypothetical protein
VARAPGAAADRVATEVQQRVERLATLAAEAILHSLYAPQVVVPPAAEMLAYWRPYFFLPDGSVNQPGRDKVVAAVGGPEYERIARDLARAMRRDHRSAADEAQQALAQMHAQQPPAPPTLAAPQEAI